MPKTIVKDQATAEFAARNLDSGAELPGKAVEPNAPKISTTSEKLFPEFLTDDGAIVNRPVKPFEDKDKVLPASDTTPQKLESQKPPAAPPTPPAYLTLEELAGKMVRTKVDGIEKDVPVESVIKSYQLEQALNARLMSLAQERKAFEDERAALLKAPSPTNQTPAKPPKQEAQKSEEYLALEAKYQQTQAQMAALTEAIKPQLQESGIKKIEQRVKDTFGADDYQSYHGKIKDFAFAEAAKYTDNPQALSWLDSADFYFQKYQEMKLRDLSSKSNIPPPANQNAPVLQTQSGAPVVINAQGKPVSIPVIEGSGGVPSRVAPDADYAAKAQSLFDQARQTGKTEDWMAYYRAKTQGS